MLRVDTRQTARPFPVVAPIGGLNGRDGLAAMAPQDAYVLDNWFPGTDAVESRKGYAPHVRSVGAAIETLAVYAGGNVAKMIAFAGGKIYDVSAPLVAATQLAAGRTNNRVQTAMFSNAGNQFLVGTSKGDVPFSYNGNVVANLNITGIKNGATSLNNVFPFKGRLYFLADGQLGFYYLDVGNIQGAASYFDLSQVARNGGSVIAIASFTADEGNGPSDYILFVTSMGEYIAYSGYDPTNIENWTLSARYYAASPVNASGVLNYNSDLYFLTDEGLLSLTDIRRNRGADAQYASLSSKLGRHLSSLNTFADNHGWQALLYAKGGMLVLNVPTSSSETGAYVQFVMNTKTSAWSRFTGMNGLSWVVFNKELYFATVTGAVFKADTGNSDNGKAIRLDSKQAYNYFDDGYGATNKHFHFAKLLIAANGRPPLYASFNTDFADDPPVFLGTPNGGEDSRWDTSVWDQSGWGDEYGTQTFLVSVGQFGIAGSLWLRAEVLNTQLRWFATQYIFSKARGLL